ncbi:hypothetical protein GW17_00013731, partial [Ensete ventricosum]
GEIQSVFFPSSRELKILAFPNILACEKSYEHGFMKKHDGHNHCAYSRFDRFFVHHHGKLYEHSFTKKYDGHKFYTKSR